MIIYLSGPMSGLPDDNKPVFRIAAHGLRQQGHTVVNPAEIEIDNPTYERYLREDLKAMLLEGCDTIALLPGWESSRGARGEVFVAFLIGMHVVDAWTLEPISVTAEAHIRVTS